MNEEARRHLKALAVAGYRPPDGVIRPPEDEHRLNAVVRNVFDGPDGREVLAWLHRITTLRNLPDDATEAQLRALNAQCNLIAIIEERIEHGRRGRPGIDTSGK